jgi:hypothetical protein
VRFLLVVGDLHEVPDHAPDQFDQCPGRRLEPAQMRQIRIGLAFLGEDFRVKRCLGREVLEQQALRNRGRGGDAFGRRARKPVAGKATLGGARMSCRRKSLVIRRVDTRRE